MRAQSLLLFTVVLLLLAAVGPAAAEEAPPDPLRSLVTWVDQFGTDGNDYAYGVAVDGRGTVYVAGGTSGKLGDTAHGSIDGFVRAYDPWGTVLWTDQFGTGDVDVARGVAVNTTGTLYVTGETNGAFPGETGSGAVDGFVRAYDPWGTVLWTDQFGTDGNDYAYGVAVDGRGTVYVAGQTSGKLGDTAHGSIDGFVRAYDPAGAVLWTDQFGTSSRDVAYGVAVDGGGRVYVAGETSGKLGDTAHGSVDGFVRAYDPSGAVLWTDQFGTVELDVARGVAADGGGNVYVAGDTNGLLGDTSYGFVDGFVRAYDPSGAVLWTDQFGTNNIDNAYGVAVDGAGNVYPAGSTLGAFPGETGYGSADGFVRAYDPVGAVSWTDQFGTSGFDAAMGVAGGAGDYVYAAGSTTGVFPGQTGYRSLDGFVLALEAAPVTPAELIRQLLAQIEGLNLLHGISNSLDAKLSNGVKALEDVNSNNDVSAVNRLDAMINEVQAQAGTEIPPDDADGLIAAAQQIISLLSS